MCSANHTDKFSTTTTTAVIRNKLIGHRFRHPDLIGDHCGMIAQWEPKILSYLPNSPCTWSEESNTGASTVWEANYQSSGDGSFE